MSAFAESGPGEKVLPEACGQAAAEAVGPMPRCPKCGWRDVRPARLRGALDWTLRRLNVTAFRCRSCNHRFYRHHRMIGS